jgi:hypothetical protein
MLGQLNKMAEEIMPLMGKYPKPSIRNKGTYLIKKSKEPAPGRSTKELQSYISEQSEGTLKTASCNVILTNEVMSSFFEKISALTMSGGMGKSMSVSTPAPKAAAAPKPSTNAVAAKPMGIKATKPATVKLPSGTDYQSKGTMKRTVVQTGVPR